MSDVPCHPVKPRRVTPVDHAGGSALVDLDGPALRRAREEAGLRQVDVALLAVPYLYGLSRPTLQRMETATHRQPVEVAAVMALAEILDVDPQSLVVAQ